MNISRETKKDLFWFVVSLVLVSAYLTAIYYVELPRWAAGGFGFLFLGLAFTMLFQDYFEEWLGALLLGIASFVPFGQALAEGSMVGWTPLRILLPISGVLFSVIAIARVARNVLDRFD